MMSAERVRAYRGRAAAVLRGAGVVLRAEEEGAIEIVDFGLGRFEREGLAILVYVNTERYCAKELVMWAGQRCPQHRHPPFDGGPGKEETFRCRSGRVKLWVGEARGGSKEKEGSAGGVRGQAGVGSEWYQVLREIELRPGEQFTIPPDTWHWFEAGDEGAVVSEFSSASRDELDVFLDPAVRRVEAGEAAGGASWGPSRPRS